MRKVSGDLRVGPSNRVTGGQVVKVGGIGVRGYTKKLKEEGGKTGVFLCLVVVAAALCIWVNSEVICLSNACG